MFEESSDIAGRQTPGKVYLHQTGAVIHAQPAADSEMIARLIAGTPFFLRERNGDVAAEWLPVQTVAGEEGYIRATTRTTTSEQVQQERLRLQRNQTVGTRKIGLGSVVLLAGIAFLILVLLRPYAFMHSYGYANVKTFLFPLMVIRFGAGEIYWGVEQGSNIRYTLRQFDSQWEEALQ